MGSKRAVFRIQLDLHAKRAIDELCEQRGMTQIAVMSRLVKWFVQQDGAIQSAVLGQLTEEHMAHLASVMLARMASLRPNDQNKTGPRIRQPLDVER